VVNKLRLARSVRSWLQGDEGAYLVHEDNEACIRIADAHASAMKRSKHIDGRYHVAREAVNRNEIKLRYINTQLQLADALTKDLGPIRFAEHMAKILCE
jgi:hypothetical protein